MASFARFFHSVDRECCGDAADDAASQVSPTCCRQLTQALRLMGSTSTKRQETVGLFCLLLLLLLVNNR